jgi:leucyl-tRNA synthetase
MEDRSEKTCYSLIFPLFSRGPALPGYDPKSIESKWQKYWLENRTFRALDPGDPGFDPTRPKSYILDMFPYPSGEGLHVGHPEGYTATDIFARYKRMKGYNVLHPMGWDSFGLPAEQYAIKTGQHPAVTTKQNIERFKGQIQRLGLSYDWERELATSDPSYYRWTQWIFRKLHEKGLAYQSEVPVWWCQELGTVLANEEVDNEGKSEVGGFPCVRRNMRQWMLRITAYAQRLLDDLEGLDWPTGIIKMQEDWIGRSDGADVVFKVARGQAEGETITVFTTRPDTLYGATYMVLAPEHPLALRLTTPRQKEAVARYLDQSSHRSERERVVDSKEKSGVFTGSHVVNPVNSEEIPVWIADYVLAGYGTGAIMAVPAHDERDFDFAIAKQLGLRTVVAPKNGKAFSGKKALLDGVEVTCFPHEGVAVNSGFLDGLESQNAKEKMIQLLEAKGLGKRVVRYKLRDWLFSRQRYWGEPFPIIHGTQGPLLAAEEDLPISLPEMESFKPAGGFEPPLSQAKQWLRTPLGERETNVMPQWAGSCWYFLRFLDPQNTQAPWDKAKADYWMPVDLYIGGAEHAVLHLLYARFWYKVFFDLGLVAQKEPFLKLYNQGMIIGTAYKTRSGSVVKTEEVRWVAGQPRHPESGEELLVSQAKMSKSLGNVVNPDHVIDEYGADSLRLYEMFMGPLDQGKVWDTNGINGMARFLKRVWNCVAGDDEAGHARLAPSDDGELDRALHRCISQVGVDIEGLRFNTAISAMMIFLNEVGDKALSRDQAELFVLVLAPFAPHLAEELWSRLGHPKTLAWETWPRANEALLVAKTVEVVIQINGKLRSRLELAAGLSAAETEKLALGDAKVLGYLGGQAPKKVIVVPGKLVNVVL